MILEVEEWHLGYHKILTDCRQAGEGMGKCLILCHADVDALAAARILTYMLRADQIEYTLLPCSTWAALQTAVTGGNSNNSMLQYAAIVLLNVGATRNLTKLFGDGPDRLQLGTTKVFVLDGRRPVHLANVHAENHVVVFWDPSHGSLEDMPSDGDNLSGKDDDDDDDEESEGENASNSDDSSSSSSSSSDSGDEAEEEFGQEQDDTQGVPQPPKGNNLNDNDTTVDMDVDIDDQNQNQNNPAIGMDVDYDGEDEREPKDDSTSPRKKKKKTKQAKTAAAEDGGNDTDSTQDLDGSEGEDEEEEDDDDGMNMNATPTTPTTAPSTAPSATASTTVPPLTPAERHRQRQDRLRLYYSHGTSHGAPTSFVAHQIATQNRFGHVADLLWLCMVGVTDAWLHSRLDILGYAKMAESLRDQCLKLFPDPELYERADNTVYAEDLLVHLNGNNGNHNNHKTKLTFSERGRIMPQTDHRFFLLRFSTLLDAMQCSNYVSTQLQLWTKPGMQRLQELLAKMGYKLEECQQPYTFLKPTLRRQLGMHLAANAEEFDLDELEFTSFVRVTGFSNLTSASDTCYAASALLECPTVSTASSSLSKQITSSGGTTADPKQCGDWDLECFHAAYDALGGGFQQQYGAKSSIHTGIQWAIKLQRLILATAIGLVSRNAITRLRHFRYAYVTASSASGVSSNYGQYQQQQQQQQLRGRNSSNTAPYHVLAKPLALTRLAYYLIDMHRANGKWVGEKKALPLILLAEQPITQTYLVLGQQMAEKEGYLSKNKFGQHFELVAQTMNGAVARLESFDSNVVEVDATHAERFLEQLHYFMDSA